MPESADATTFIRLAVDSLREQLEPLPPKQIERALVQLDSEIEKLKIGMRPFLPIDD